MRGKGSARVFGSRIVPGLFIVFSAALTMPRAAGPSLLEAVGKPYQRLIEETAARYQLDPRLLEAVVEVESARRADAVSPKGAQGLAQLMPATARRLGVADPHDPADNLDGAARYLVWLIDRYQGDLRLALAAYNAGEGAVDRSGGIPAYPETRNYVGKVLTKAGLRARGPRTGPDPVRLVRRNDGSVLITNLP